MTYQEAISVIEKALAEKARGCTSAPDVDIQVSWIEVTNLDWEGRGFIPRVRIEVSRTEQLGQ